MGGIETHLQTLCSLLRDRVSLEVIVFGDDRHTVEEVVDGIHVVRLGKSLDIAGAPISWTLTSRIRAAAADIVHIHLPNPFATIAYLASNHRGRLVVSYHGDIVRQRILSPFYNPVLHATLLRAAAILVATPNHISSSPMLLKHESRCHVVPYGIDVEHFRSSFAEEAATLREQAGRPLILGVGRLVYYKGFEVLIRSMREVDAGLVIIGEGPLHRQLEATARSEGVSDRVTILGGVPDLRPYYQACDIFVLSSVAKSEGFGIVQLEAMASGKPVINTSLPSGVPFVSVDGLTGLTVPPSDPAALSEAMNRLLRDQPLRTRFGEAGIRRVVDHFSREAMAERTVEVYDRILAADPTISG